MSKNPDLENFINILTNLTQIVKVEAINIVQSQDIKNDLTEQNREQLWQGETTEGKNIRPYHSESKFFKSKKQVEGYIKFKQKIIKDVGKPTTKGEDVPNLYINGKFHSEIKTENITDGVELNAQGIMSTKILPTFDNILGVKKQHLDELTQSKIIPDIIKELNKLFK